MFALERFIARMDAYVFLRMKITNYTGNFFHAFILITYLQVMLEFESLSAVRTLEPPQYGRLVVTDHMPLKAINVGEMLVANFARLQKTGKKLTAAPPLKISTFKNIESGKKLDPQRTQIVVT